MLVYISDFTKTESQAQFAAYRGFKKMGYYVKVGGELPKEKETIVVSGVNTVIDQLKKFDAYKHVSSYPDELNTYLGRKIWTSTIDEVANGIVDGSISPCFVKPKFKEKFFTGRVVNSLSDLRNTGLQNENYEVWCSNSIDIIAEFRCFVINGVIQDVIKYKGNYNIQPDYEVIVDCILDYKSAPSGYAMDFCVTKKGTFLLEVNDGYALADYGLFFINYAKLLAIRWCELTGTEYEGN